MKSRLKEKGFHLLPWATFGRREAFSDFEKKHAQQEQWSRLIPAPVIVSLIVTVENPKMEKFLEETLTAIELQSYGHWEAVVVVKRPFSYRAENDRVSVVTCAADSNSSQMKNSGLEKATGEWVGFISAGDILSPVALYFFLLKVKSAIKPDLVYCNEAMLSLDSRKLSQFLTKPKSSWFNLLHLNAIGKLWIAPRKTVVSLKGFDEKLEAQEEHEFLLRMLEKTERWEGIPAFLYYRRHGSEETTGKAQLPERVNKHLKRKGFAGSAHLQKGSLKILPVLENPKEKLVSVIICFRNKADWTLRCLGALANQVGTVPIEVFLVNNQSSLEELEKVRSGIKGFSFPVEIIDYPHAFNYGNMHNSVIREKSKGATLLLLNNDVFFSSEKKLDELVSWASQPFVGTVGILLRYAHGAVQHSGLDASFGGEARMARVGNAQGKDSFHYESHEVFGNTFAACLMKRSTYDLVGGFRELDLANGFGDIAFSFECLKQGFRNIYLGHVEAVHLESASRGLSYEYWEECILESEYAGILQQMLRQDLGYDRIPQEDNQALALMKQLIVSKLRIHAPWLKLVKRRLESVKKISSLVPIRRSECLQS